ncbi:hypothetical protein MSAN_01000800 [Mycena sanguinolenta]|uniref:Uncharacterized protein n=1 Tax=Mycena sanguinolenta TaxID=230812 RepID=A0A8H6YLT0_9AGAR|nr:hypothetical protein MSAN_01000800 [Mycena sanguinolenta]
MAPKKIKPKRYHGYAVLLFILGTLFPPLAVAARFGIGGDFWLNLLLTICGYIPGHGHNFYIQNIRNNKNHARTPKWAQRYGLVDTSEIKRKERKSQWQSRYNDRLPRSTLEGAAYAEGQDHASSVDLSSDGHQPPQGTQNGELWRQEDEQYYNEGAASSGGGRWHYPANFDDAATPSKSSKKKKKSDKKDRWARTEDAYSISEEQSQRKKKKKKSKSSSSTYSGSTTEFPEAAEGGLYGDHAPPAQSTEMAGQTTDDVFSHEF